MTTQYPKVHSAGLTPTGLVAFLDSGKKLMAVTRAGGLRLWDTTSWKSLIDERLTEPHGLMEAIKAVKEGAGKAAVKPGA